MAGAFLFFGFGFMDMYLQNPSEFTFGFARPALFGMGLAIGAGLAVTAALAAALRGKVFDAAVLLVLGLTLAAWLQGSFLNYNLGHVDGQRGDWGWEAGPLITDTAIWLAALGLPFLVRAARPRASRLIEWLVPTVLTGAMAAALVATYAQSEVTPWQPETADYPTYQGAFTASTTANQYIFVLDMMDQNLVRAIEEEAPDFFASHLDGFTQFDNHISNYTHTFPSAVHMLTGEWYYFDEPLEEYMARAYAEGSFLQALRDAGYSTNIYATNTYSYSDISDIEDLADNVHQASVHQPTAAEMVVGFMRLAGYRYAPQALKPAFWVALDPFSGMNPYYAETDAFSNSNFDFYRRLTNTGLSLGGHTPRFSFFHLDGAHLPVNMNAEVELVPGDSVPLTEQAKGAFRIVFDYIDELKRLGRYQDASIVITGDHGQWIDGDSERLSAPRLTALFFKPAGSAGSPLGHSDAPTEMANVRASLLADAGAADPDGAATLFEVQPGSAAPRDFFNDGPPHRGSWIDHWQVTGDARSFANWHFVSRIDMIFFD
jgi:hypothetical protein